VLKNGVNRYNIFFFYFYTKLAESSLIFVSFSRRNLQYFYLWRAFFQQAISHLRKRFSQFSGCWLILSVYTCELWLSLCKIVRSSVILLLPLFTEWGHCVGHQWSYDHIHEYMNIMRVNIECFTGCKRIKQRRISFVPGYFRIKISTAISIKHRILATFNIKKISILTACMPLINIYTVNYLKLQ
jgi:hypothetical protein